MTTDLGNQFSDMSDRASDYGYITVGCHLLDIVKHFIKSALLGKLLFLLMATRSSH